MSFTVSSAGCVHRGLHEGHSVVWQLSIRSVKDWRQAITLSPVDGLCSARKICELAHMSRQIQWRSSYSPDRSRRGSPVMPSTRDGQLMVVAGSLESAVDVLIVARQLGGPSCRAASSVMPSGLRLTVHRPHICANAVVKFRWPAQRHSGSAVAYGSSGGTPASFSVRRPPAPGSDSRCSARDRAQS